MIDKTKVFKYILLFMFIIYSIFAFVINSINPFFHIHLRVLYISIVCFGFMILITINDINNFSLFTKETIEEKETRMKKYVWELKEELELYNEAKDLEKRINELRRK